MKLALALFMFISAQAFASVCNFETSYDFREAIQEIASTPTGARFTFAEKNLVHRTISLQNYYEGLTRDEAMTIFTERHADGEILYFNYQGKKVALVHYYPGDNEYGAFYEVRLSGAGKLLAVVGDGDITCVEE